MRAALNSTLWVRSAEISGNSLRGIAVSYNSSVYLVTSSVRGSGQESVSLSDVSSRTARRPEYSHRQRSVRPLLRPGFNGSRHPVRVREDFLPGVQPITGSATGEARSSVIRNALSRTELALFVWGRGQLALVHVQQLDVAVRVLKASALHTAVILRICARVLGAFESAERGGDTVLADIRFEEACSLGTTATDSYGYVRATAQRIVKWKTRRASRSLRAGRAIIGDLASHRGWAKQGHSSITKLFGQAAFQVSLKSRKDVATSRDHCRGIQALHVQPDY